MLPEIREARCAILREVREAYYAILPEVSEVMSDVKL